MDIRIRLRHIRCFLEVARRNSLAEAAETLNVSQPAVSKTLKDLEAILGVALFDRDERRLRLNAAGRQFQQHAGAALVELDVAQDAVRKAATDRTRLAVGLLPSAASDLFPRAALLFGQSRPNCVLRVATGPNWLLFSQAREGQIDMVVGRLAHDDQMTGLAFEQLYLEEVAAIVRPGHPLLKVRRPETRLQDYPLILPPAGAVIAPIVRSYLISIGLRGISAMVETVSLPLGRGLVLGSDAVWFISRGVVAHELREGSLAALKARQPMTSGPVGISIREDAIRSSDMEALFACLRDAAIDRRG